VRQRLLDFQIPSRYSYGEWIRHGNVEAVHNRIALWMVHGGNIWLSSSEAAGKTHLLHALRQEHPFLGLIQIARKTTSSINLVQKWMEDLDSSALWLVDVPAGPIPYTSGMALFHLLERARSMQRPLLVAWRCADEDLSPPELSSRLKALERVEMAAPQSDEDLHAVLRSVATSNQWQIDDAIIDLLLLRLPRQLSVLIDALHELEKASLEERRHLSRAWARKYLRRRLEEKARSSLI
jgi:chromosomal replication initiation ATPase DnaA